MRRDDAWLEEPIDGYGALASMGGVFTSVADLARWVAGFIDAFPPRDGPDDGHPLRRATRREMQQVNALDRAGADLDLGRCRAGTASAAATGTACS